MPKEYRITIFGLGLIGSSLASAIKHAAPNTYITAYDNNASTCAIARTQNIVNIAADNLKKITPMLIESDIIIFATPLLSYHTILKTIAPYIQPHTIISDVGSVKTYPAHIFSLHFGNHRTNIIPAHPIAGSEKSGIEAMNSHLFQGKLVILTPYTNTDTSALHIIKTLWEQCGAHTQIMDTRTHDRCFAELSHLPQYIAFKYKQYHQKNGTWDTLESHPSLQRFLRLTHSSEALWKDIFFTNTLMLQEAIDNYRKNTTSLLSCDHFEELLQHAQKKLIVSITDNKDEIMDPSIGLAMLIAYGLIMSASDTKHAGTGFKDMTYPLQNKTWISALSHYKEIENVKEELKNFMGTLEYSPNIDI